MKPETAPAGRRLFDALSSLRLGVVVMVALAVACALATFYESAHGTAAAQRVFYRTGWFTFLLALLGVNVLLSMLKRYPWRRHQAGFVLAHVGIVLLLVGSLVSLLTQLHKLGGRIALVNTHRNVQFLFKLTQLDRLFPICTDVLKAIERVERGG